MQRWLPGQKLTVLPITRSGHNRVPGFLEGQTGLVVCDWGDFPNPEAGARGEADATLVPVYLMVFDPTLLWPEDSNAYADRVLVDVYHFNLASDRKPSI